MNRRRALALTTLACAVAGIGWTTGTPRMQAALLAKFEAAAE